MAPYSGSPSREKSLYGRRWGKYRIRQLRAFPLCAFCLEAGRLTPATVVDHIKRHAGHGDPLFWDPANFQSLCKPCHDGAKQQIDNKGYARGFDVHGLPLDPRNSLNSKTI